MIREHRVEDIRQIEACVIELQDFERAIDPNLAEGAAIVKLYVERLFARCAETSGKVFVAEADRQVAGFASVWAKVKSEELEEKEFEYAYVSDLIVRAAYRGRGLGRALLRRAEEYAVEQGATLLRVNVLARNDVARRLYNDHGFEEYEIVLAKRLPA
jgi:ribosomal protein S18 acetylase RimI-like enzyme